MHSSDLTLDSIFFVSSLLFMLYFHFTFSSSSFICYSINIYVYVYIHTYKLSSHRLLCCRARPSLIFSCVLYSLRRNVYERPETRENVEKHHVRTRYNHHNSRATRRGAGISYSLSVISKQYDLRS